MSAPTGKKIIQRVPSFLWAILLLAIGGVIGNRSDAYFVSSLPEITKSITRDSFLWVCLGTLLILWLITLWSRVNGLDNASKLSTFDNTLHTLLPEVIMNTVSFQNVTEVFIDRAFEVTAQCVLSSPRKARLFLPGANGQFLTSPRSYGWASHGNPIPIRFLINYINNSDKSTAALAFTSKQTIIVRIKEKNGSSEGDHISYRSSVTNSSPFTGSLICVPLVIGKASNDCLGVMCFTSYDATIFESTRIQEALRLLARHIAVSLLIEQNISQRLSGQTVP